MRNDARLIIFIIVNILIYEFLIYESNNFAERGRDGTHRVERDRESISGPAVDREDNWLMLFQGTRKSSMTKVGCKYSIQRSDMYPQPFRWEHCKWSGVGTEEAV